MFKGAISVDEEETELKNTEALEGVGVIDSNDESDLNY